MCLILFAHQTIAEYPLVLLANRDEFYQRPSAPIGFWRDEPDLLAGKDLQAGGTWLGITRNGRFACVTNVRQGRQQPVNSKSRGSLVFDFLTGQHEPDQYLQQLNGDDYAGFNLILGNSSGLFYGSNRGSNRNSNQGSSKVSPVKVEPGFHGLSNAGLDTSWPKVSSGLFALRETLKKPLDETELISILQDRQQARDQDLPDTGIELEWERLLSSRFIQSHDYGTRASYLLAINHQGEVLLRELSYAPDGSISNESRFEFNFSAAASG